MVCKAKDRSRSKSTSEVESSSVDFKFQDENPVEENYLAVQYVGFGEIAALKYCVEKISKDIDGLNKLKVPHMLHEELGWIKSHPPPQPYIKLNVRVDTKAYQQNKYKPPSAYRHRSAEMSVLADSGCQACVMGTEELRKLGLTEKDLLPVGMKLHGANGSNIQILGAVFVTISGQDAAGKTWETNQLCYVAKGVGKLLLSKEALVKLGIINKSFPAVGSSEIGNPVVSEVVDTQNDEMFDLEPCTPAEDGSCNCPRREPVPEPPKFVPGLSAPDLRKIIIKHYAASAFNKCTRQALPMMRGDPLPIPVRKDAKPVAVHTPVPVPLHWEEKVKRDLLRDVSLGVIEPVPLNTPVTWCHRMVTVPKHNGEPRRTVDMQSLNKASVRQTHYTKSPFMLASSVPADKIKSVLDVWNSFHSVPLVEEDRDKTTFITPWGRYRYRVAPQGYLASMDGYTHRFSLITEGIKNKATIVDDTLIYSDNLEENFVDVCQLLSVGHKAGLVFNPDKFQFGQGTVEFAGLDVTLDGVKPCGKFLESIRSFPRPNTLSEARSFFGMINQVAYSFSMSSIMEDFRHLLKPDTWSEGFTWNDELVDKFNIAKEEIVKAVTDGVKYFDVKKQTCLATDWSRQGIGFFLLQKWCECTQIHPRCCNDGWKLVLAGGRFTRPAESRYSPVEGELLAVVDALQKTRHFILGCDKLVVAVDHKPLLGLLNDKSLADIENPRLLMLKEKTLWYNFDVMWIAGSKNNGPDYMSRTKEARLDCLMGFANTPFNHDQAASVNECFIIDSVVKSLASWSNNDVRAITFEEIKLEVSKDQEMLDLIKAIENKDGSDRFPDTVANYNRHSDDLLVVDGVPMLGRRVIVPASCRKRVLDCLHSAHQGSAKMLERAKNSVYWPGLVDDLERTRRGCSICDRNAPSQAQMPPLPLASPEFPFQMLAMDYFENKGKSWLVIADRFSGWLSLHYFPREASSSDLISRLKHHFCTFGIAEEISSDDGPQFRSSQFQQFIQLWGVKNHRVSSAYHPHSNLRAETAVKSGKRILLDNTKSDGSPDWDKVIRAVMQHRNTPDSEYGLSPSQLVFGRPIRDFLPIRPGEYKPSEVWVDSRETRELALRNRLIRNGERWSSHTRDLRPLQPGSKVMIQNQHGAGKIAKKWDKTGLVLENLGFNKYRIKVDGSGRVTDRNRQFLRQFTPVTSSQPGPRPDTRYVPVAEPESRSFSNPEPVVEPQQPVIPEPQAPMTPPRQVALPQPTSPTTPESPSFATPPTTPEPQVAEPPRRSTRVRNPPDRLSYDKF